MRRAGRGFRPVVEVVEVKVEVEVVEVALEVPLEMPLVVALVVDSTKPFFLRLSCFLHIFHQKRELM